MGKSDADRLNKVIGEEVRYWRKVAGLTQIELGRQVELSVSMISAIELGQQRVSLIALYYIAAALGCEPRDILPRLRDVHL